MSPLVWELAYEDKLRALHKHASQLSLAKSVAEIATYTLDAMEFALGFDFADITIVENKCLRMIGHRGSEQPLRDAPLDGRGVTVKAAITKSAMRVADTRKEPTYVDGNGFDWIGPPTMLSELAVPVVVDDETVAVLNVESMELKAFTASDQDLLELLAFHVGPAFRRLKHDERLMALHRHALQLGAASTVEEITRYTLDTMEIALRFDYADMRVVEGGWLRCKGARGMEMLNADLPLNGPGVTVNVAKSKKTMRILDTRKEPSYVDRIKAVSNGSPTMLSELAVPVLVEGESFAVLNVESTRLNAITGDDQTLLEMLAIHVASDIMRLRDREALQRQSADLEKLVAERTKELSSARERLDYMIQSNPAVIYSGKPLTDLSDWELTFVSDRVVSMLGYEAEKFVGHPEFWTSHVHPSDRATNPEEVQTLWRTGHHTYEYQFLHRDGTYRWIREEATAVRDASGKPIEVNGYWTDITDRKQSEKALRESEDRYRRLFESSPISLWEEDFTDVKKYLDDLRSRGVKDLRRYFVEHPEDLTKCASMVNVIDANGTTLQMYCAKSLEELSGELRRFFTSEFQDNFREELVALGEGKTQFVSEFDNQTLKGDTKHVSMILNVVPGYESTLARVLVSIVDLTERKKMEQRLQQAERMAAIGQTAAMVGHDLRNPLQAVTGAVYLLRKQSGNSEDERDQAVDSNKSEIAAMIEESVEYMNKIVSDLQNYAAPTHPELATISINQLLNDTLSAIHIPSGVKVSMNLEDTAQTWRVDPTLMRRVFMNLITNAIQAMPDGGELTIATQKTAHETLVSFQDTGKGILEDDLPKLFQPFHTTKAQGQGLGLPVCKRLVEAHGGHITVNSVPGKGSTFTVELPVMPSKEME